MKGRFIVFEGIDGAGKSTQISLLEKKLKSEGRLRFVTAEPRSPSPGGALRDALSGNYKRTSTELAAMFLADRVFHNVNEKTGIMQALENGFDVICDRYYYSSFAYQGTGSSLEWVMRMNLDCPDIVRPDVCIFLDLDAESSKKRIDSERASVDIFEESTDILSSIRNKFFDVFEKLPDENIKIVNAGRTVSEIAADIAQIIDGLTAKE